MADIDQLILNALDHPTKPYRTIKKMSQELSISEYNIETYIKSSPQIKKAFVPNKFGEDLYCRKEYRMLFRECMVFLQIALFKPEYFGTRK